jgi:hypothetical protein
VTVTDSACAPFFTLTKPDGHWGKFQRCLASFVVSRPKGATGPALAALLRFDEMFSFVLICKDPALEE